MVPRLLIGGLLLLVLMGSATAANRAAGVDQLLTIGEESRRGGDAACFLSYHTGTAASYVPDYAMGDRTVSYYDPADCGSYPLYPFEVTQFAFTLFDDGSAVWPVMVDIVIYAPDDHADPCSGPGEELYRLTVAASEADFSAPTVGTVDLSYCVYGPFYIGLEYANPGPGPFPSVLFDDDTVPDSCYHWFFNWSGSGQWSEWYDLFGDPPAGNPVWSVTGETSSGICDTLDLQTYYWIPVVYDSIQYLEGTEVNVIGEFISDDVPLLVTDYWEYTRDQKMPPFTDMVVTGMLPDPAYWYGGMVIATGVVTSAPDPYPAWGFDTIEVTIDVISYQYIDSGYGLETGPAPGYGIPDQPPDKGWDLDDCDSCKFAILVSSGGRARWRRPDYWVNLMTLYNHKINNEDYCPHNVFVHFDDGNAQDSDDLPDSLVKPATESAIGDTHDEISRRIAECHRNGKKSTVQKLFTNHGSNDNGVVLTEEGDGHYLSPEEATAMQQKLIDSCCAWLYDEFITCYGGDMLNGLKDLDNKNKTQIHANSAAPDYAPGWSRVRRITDAGDTVYIPHQYLESKVNALASGVPYEEAVRTAEEDYIEWLRTVVIPGQVRDSTRTENRLDHWRSERDRGWDLFVDGHLTWAQWINWRNTCDSAITANQNRLNKINTRLSNLRRQVEGDPDDGSAQGCPSWVRYSFHEYCEWKKFYAPPGGQLTVDFDGDGSTGHCGNVTVWERQEDGTWERERQWNWNLPGSPFFSEGNDQRVIHVPADGTGEYWIHNDDGEHTITVESYSGRPDVDESPSNPALGFGFSLGSDDESPAEFGYFMGTGHISFDVDQDGYNLSDVPAFVDPFEGVGQYTATFTVGEGELWSDMEIVLDVLHVNQPGTLLVECPTAEIQTQIVELELAGTYPIHLGGITPDESGYGQITFAPQGECGFILDAWGLRSLLKALLDNCIIRGDINHDGVGPDIADLVYLVSYMFSGGPPPVVMEEADINGDGVGPDISDLVYLVAYMFSGGPAPVPCP